MEVLNNTKFLQPYYVQMNWRNILNELFNYVVDNFSFKLVSFISVIALTLSFIAKYSNIDIG